MLLEPEVADDRAVFRHQLRVRFARQDVHAQGTDAGAGGKLNGVGGAIGHGAVHADLVSLDAEHGLLRTCDLESGERGPRVLREQGLGGIVELGAELADLLIEGRGLGVTGGFGGDAEPGEVVAHVGVLGGIPEGEEAVVILVAEGIVGMGVALDAAEGGALPDGPGGVDAVDDGVESELLVVGAALGVGLGVAVEAGGDEVFEGAVREQVAGEGLDRELVERQVGVQGADEPVAPRPDIAAVVLLVSLGIGVAGEIEPEGGPAFAEVDGAEKAVDGLFAGFLAADEAGEFIGRGRKAGEVEADATQPLGGVRGGAGLESLLFESGEDEAVGFGPGPFCVLHRRHPLRQRLDEGPVFAPLGAFADPLPQRGDFVGAQRTTLAVFVGRHVIVIALGEHDAMDQFGGGGIAGDERAFPGLAGGERLVAVGEGDVAGLFDAAVATGAVLVEDGSDVVVEVDGGASGRGQKRSGDDGEREGRA